jgi:hypothetical protein
MAAPHLPLAVTVAGFLVLAIATALLIWIAKRFEAPRPKHA